MSVFANSILEKLFSHAPFDRLDRAVLVRRYDTTADLSRHKTRLRQQAGQSVQLPGPILAIPPQGIVLNQSGTYQFAGDLLWSPQAIASAAITITASNVVLDLGGCTLTAVGPDRSQSIVGIQVLNSVSNVTIQNGTVANLCYAGILAEHVDGLTITGVTVDGLCFHNLAVRNLTPTGIQVSDCTQVTLANCTVQNVYVTADASAGIQIVGTQGGTVSGCTVQGMVNTDGSVQGYSCIYSAGINTRNCVAANFRSEFNGNVLTLGHTVLGFVPIFCIELAYENCSATRMIGCCDDCHGMSVFLDALVSVSNFTADTVVDGVTATQTGAKATGLEVYGALISVSSCAVSNITAIRPQDKQAAGFSAWGAGIIFTACAATNVNVVDPTGLPNASLGHGTGFGWAPDPRPVFSNIGAFGVQYLGCSAVNCQVGFDTWCHVDSQWNLVSCLGCATDILIEPNTATRTLTANACSECIPPITTVVTNSAAGNTISSL